MDSLDLLTQAVDDWTRIHGYALVDVPWLPERTAHRSLRRLVSQPQAANGLADLWRKGALPTAPGYIAWRPIVTGDADSQGLRRSGSVVLDVFIPVACVLEARGVLGTLMARNTLVLASLAAKLGEPGVRIAVHHAADDRRRLLLHGMPVASHGMHAARFGRYVYGTALALPGFTEAVAARNRACRPVVPTPPTTRARFAWLTRLAPRPPAPQAAESRASGP